VRVLLLSDIHSNLEALEACLAAAPAWDLAINLGDVVGYGASPNEVIARLRPLSRWHVRGNHDRASAGLTDVKTFNPIAAAAALWTRQALTPENLEWLRALPPGPLAVDGLAGVHFVHGSPLDEDQYLIGVTDALDALLVLAVPLTFFGHTHIQGGFFLYANSGSELHNQIEPGDELESSEMQLNRDARYLINPGSVGQPRDGDWRAGFAVFESDSYTIRFYRVPYDLDTAQRRILDANLPQRLASRLALGR
jgi:diadenosine tetraphosphatase ApaH/serine/threonine PP2A family protein phosphatase